MKLQASAIFLSWSLFSLAGCGSSAENISFDQNPPAGPPPRVNTLVVTDTTPGARFQASGHLAEHVTATGFDAQGNQVFGPDEEDHDEEMVFSGFPDSTTKVRLDYNRGQGFTLARHERNVDFVNDDDGVIALRGVSPQALDGDRRTFTVRVANTSDYPDDQVFVSVIGKNPEDTRFFYVKFGANDDNRSVPFGGVANSSEYSQPLSSLKPEGEKIYSFQCPYENLVSGRIYLSFGKKLQGLGLNNPSDGLSLQLPSATGAPDYQTVYEFMELSATSDAHGKYTLYANTSVVDFFSLGLGMTMEYHTGSTNRSESVGFVDGAREKILAEFAKASTPNEFRNYVARDGAQTVLRVLAPVQKLPLEPDGALAHFLDSAIDAGWSHYSSVVLSILDNLPQHQPYGYTYSGELIRDGILSMTCTAKPSGDTAGGALESLNENCRLSKPTSRIVFDCDDSSAPSGPDKDSYRNAGSQGHKRLVSFIGAALNRGVFENYSDWADPTKFYTRADGKYNHYSKIMHMFALDQKVYGFGYDDVYGQDPTLAQPLDEVNQVIITIPRLPVL